MGRAPGRGPGTPCWAAGPARGAGGLPGRPLLTRHAVILPPRQLPHQVSEDSRARETRGSEDGDGELFRHPRCGGRDSGCAAMGMRERADVDNGEPPLCGPGRVRSAREGATGPGRERDLASLTSPAPGAGAGGVSVGDAPPPAPPGTSWERDAPSRPVDRADRDPVAASATDRPHLSRPRLSNSNSNAPRGPSPAVGFPRGAPPWSRESSIAMATGDLEGNTDRLVQVMRKTKYSGEVWIRG